MTSDAPIFIVGSGRSGGGGVSALPILTFHALDDEPSPLSFPPALFRRAIDRLAERGWRSIRLADAAASLRDGRPLPDRSFVLTFDDGYETVRDVALPVLRRHGMTATVFVIAGRGGAGAYYQRRPLLDWGQMREMRCAGIDFGAHTTTHADLTRLAPAQAAAEVAGSKAAIEDALGCAVDSFAYPFGRYDARSVEIVRRHFACACTDRLGLARARSDVHALARVETFYLRSPRAFDLIFTPHFPLYLAARNVPRTVRRALLGGGGGSTSVSAAPESSGAATATTTATAPVAGPEAP